MEWYEVVGIYLGGAFLCMPFFGRFLSHDSSGNWHLEDDRVYGRLDDEDIGFLLAGMAFWPIVSILAVVSWLGSRKVTNRLVLGKAPKEIEQKLREKRTKELEKETGL